MLIEVCHFEQLANNTFFCKPGKLAVEVIVSLSAVYGGEAYINLLCTSGVTDLKSNIKEQ